MRQNDLPDAIQIFDTRKYSHSITINTGDGPITFSEVVSTIRHNKRSVDSMSDQSLRVCCGGIRELSAVEII